MHAPPSRSLWESGTLWQNVASFCRIRPLTPVLCEGFYPDSIRCISCWKGPGLLPGRRIRLIDGCMWYRKPIPDSIGLSSTPSRDWDRPEIALWIGSFWLKILTNAKKIVFSHEIEYTFMVHRITTIPEFGGYLSVSVCGGTPQRSPVFRF